MLHSIHVAKHYASWQWLYSFPLLILVVILILYYPLI
jgi:hypothetical protein